MLFLNQLMIQHLSAPKSGIKTTYKSDFGTWILSKSEIGVDRVDISRSLIFVKQLKLDQI
jgi:hypothetical protein